MEFDDEKLKEVSDLLFKLATGREKPAFKGQDKYLKLFLDLNVPKERKSTPALTIRMDNPALIRELIKTLHVLGSLPKSINMGTAEVVAKELTGGEGGQEDEG